MTLILLNLVFCSVFRISTQKACESILKPRDNDVPEMQRVREQWWENRQAKEALTLLQRHDRGGRSIESKLLMGLIKNGPNDYVNSLENVSKKKFSTVFSLWAILN